MVLSTELESRLAVPWGRYVLPLVPVLLAVMVYAASRAPLTGRLLESGPLRLLGVISYGVYVYHLPVIHMTARMVRRVAPQLSTNLVVLALVSLAVTVVVATLSWLLLELPLMAVVRRWLARRRSRSGGAVAQEVVVAPVEREAAVAAPPVKARSGGWRAR